jgi:hypothetical protein
MLAVHQQLGVPLEDMALSLDPQLLVAKDGAGIKCAGQGRGGERREDARRPFNEHDSSTSRAAAAAAAKR